MITVHHLGVSQSERIVWLMEELGLPYELRRYDRDPQTRLAPAAYKALHPMGTAPVITDGDLTLGESGAIMEYILARYGDGRLVPAVASPDYPHYLFWMHAANASIVASEMSGMIAAFLGASEDHPVMAMVGDRRNRGYTLIEARLGEAPYFAGEAFTAADIMMVFALTTMRAFAPRDLKPYPHIRAYLQRIGGRPAYRRAMAKGDPAMEPMLA